MAYNIGEKAGKESYLCPNCGCRVGEMPMIVRRDVSSLGRDTIQPAYTVKKLSPRLAKLKSLTLILVLAGLVFVSGFAAKTLLTRGRPSESPIVSGESPIFGDTSVNVNTRNTGVNSADAIVGAGNPSVTVWVNTQSGVYHCANTRWYGNTKSGKYMTQREAQSKGYRPAHGSACG